MKKFLIAMLIALTNQAFAQPASLSTLKQLTDSIKAIVKKQHIPGLMLSITTKDAVLFSGGFGYADLEAKYPVNGQTMFRLGSITKSFVAVAIMQLVESGKLQLDTELKNIAPEVPFLNQWEAGHPVKIINLLEHTTGFDDFKLNKMYTLDRKSYSTKQLMMLQRRSMICRWRPDERYSYSNVNYVILGYIIKKITGMEYSTYLTEHILRPLHMAHSNFNLYPKYLKYDVKEYDFDGYRNKHVPSVTCLIGPAGSLWSSADDMAHFLKFLLRKGEPLLTQASISEMEKPHSSLAAKAGLKTGYALGNEDYGTFRGHEGLMGACRSKYMYSIELGVGFAISSNGNGLSSIEKVIVEFLTKHKRGANPVTYTLDKNAIEPYLGYYQVQNPRFDILSFTDKLMMLNVDIQHDTLIVNIFGKEIKMEPRGRFTFGYKGAVNAGLVFTVNEDGRKVLILNGRYCEKIYGPWAIFERVLIAIFILASFLSYIPAVIAVVAAARKKMPWSSVPLKVLPALAICCLMWAFINFIKVQEASYLIYKFNNINATSISIFLGTLLFGLLSFLNLVLVFKRLKAVTNRFTTFFMLTIAIAIFGLALLLLLNGWLGLATWAM